MKSRNMSCPTPYWLGDWDSQAAMKQGFPLKIGVFKWGSVIFEIRIKYMPKIKTFGVFLTKLSF